MSRSPLEKTISLLSQLIAFPTVSRDSNLELICFVESYLSGFGIESRLVHNAERTKANLYATIGPADVPGVMLSGHTDVVPIDNQDWSSDPFVMREKSGRLYGRGAADMKGFIACVLGLVDRLDLDRLATPIQLAFSYDEEVGCVGVRRLIDIMENAPVRPRFCIVGEPTSMQLVVAHKGKTAGRATCIGQECHSSLAPQGLNAIYLAYDMIGAVRRLQDEIMDKGPHDDAYDVAFTTLHVGIVSGGTALNIVPNHCQFDFEIRHLPQDSPTDLLERLRNKADLIVAPHRNRFPHAAIELSVVNSYPALDTAPDSDLVRFIQSLTGANTTAKITFGTEGGLFSQRLGIETVVLGPGDIVQAHKPDEFIARDQLDQCNTFLDRLSAALCSRGT